MGAAGIEPATSRV